MRTIILGLLSLLLLVSCSSATRDREEVNTTLRVENQSWLDMNVYVVRESQRLRLGTVRGLSTEVLVLPRYLIVGPTSLQFLADPIGGRQTPVSQEITVSPGDEVEMVIPN